MGKKAVEIVDLDVKKLIEILNQACQKSGWPIISTGSGLVL